MLLLKVSHTDLPNETPNDDLPAFSDKQWVVASTNTGWRDLKKKKKLCQLSFVFMQMYVHCKWLKCPVNAAWDALSLCQWPDTSVHASAILSRREGQTAVHVNLSLQKAASNCPQRDHSQ